MKGGRTGGRQGKERFSMSGEYLKGTYLMPLGKVAAFG